ncbi:MAG: glycoside hydrolase family 3 C-terminal domain-containing protein [Bacteroidales bacterium]|nr:glycoside hydrolase family 3 C-terminal domain-containing protein [Bacteroidales bacterium]
MRRFLYLLTICFAPLTVQAQPRLAPGTVDEVLRAMTLEEKATLLVGANQGVLYGGSAESHDYQLPASVRVYDNRMGVGGSTYAFPHLGITPIVMADGPAGLRLSVQHKGKEGEYYCTAFPVGTALASSWNTELVRCIGEAMGDEACAYGVDVMLAPGMNLHRNPLNGRNFEYYSEDPLLSGKMAAAMVSGIQSRNVGTSVKHFAVNSQETNRKDNDDILGTRALRELYLKGFEIVVKEARPWTVMSSYNRINGPYTQEDPALLTTILRDEWGFDGIVLSDWTARRNTAAQVSAGNDLMMPGNRDQMQEIVEKVRSGELPEADVDLCVRRILEVVLRTHTFQGLQPTDQPDLKAHAALSRAVAAEGMVLLKNEGVLPLKDVETIDLYGNTSYRFISGGTGSGRVNAAYTVSLKEGLEGAGYRLDGYLDALYSAYLAYQDALHAEETYSILNPAPAVPELSIGREKLFGRTPGDVAVVTLGRNAGEATDRKIPADFDLTSEESALLRNVCDAYHAAGKKVVVVLNVSGVIETASWKAWPDAILLAWQLGQEGGNVVADALSGAVNPSGKLTMTFPLQYFDHPSSYNFPFDFVGPPSFGPVMSVTGRKEPLVRNVDYTLYEEGIYVGYRYFSSFGKEVSYPFGYGLSYTSFAYSKPAVKASSDGFVASVTVTNTGSVAGKEAVQLYVTAPSGGLEKPARELKAFAKTRLLSPGESEVLSFPVSAYALASFNEAASAWEAAAGQYQLHFGASVEDLRCGVPFRLSKASRWEVHRVMEPSQPLHELSLNH